MPEISIIMPVYNAEKTVGRMVDSIINQTFDDWELIVVDDGSTDRSGIILDGYASRDSRIHVIHKQNEGVAVARQTGFENVSGIYIIHADSDDWIESTMLEDMLLFAKRHKADIVISDYFVNSANGNQCVVKQRLHTANPKEVLFAVYAKDLFGGLWHKLIRKSVYDKAHAQFIPGINYCEDLLVLTQILACANPVISFLPKAYYHYVENPSSLTRSVSEKGFESMKRFHVEVVRYLPREDRFANVVRSFAINEFLVLFINRLYQGKSDLLDEYLKIKQTLKGRYGLRWNLGFWCIEHGMVGLAHRLIKC